MNADTYAKDSSGSRAAGAGRRLWLPAAIALLALLFLTTACKSSGDGGSWPPGDKTAPAASVEVLGASVLAGGTPISIRFSEPVDPTSLQLGGSLAPSILAYWSASNTPQAPAPPGPPPASATNLLLRPITETWPSGSGHTLTVDVTDEAGNAMQTLTMAFDVVAAARFVHPNGNDNTGDGSAENPFATIQHAIDSLGDGPFPSAVLVAEGTYSAAYDGGVGQPVADMVGGVSLYGGYHADDWCHCTPAEHPTVLEDQSTGGGGYLDPNYVVSVPADATQDTVLAGFTIQAGGGSVSAGVLVDSGSPTLRFNIIDGGTGSFYGDGIVVKGTASTAPQILANTITGGSGADQNAGIRLASPATATIVGNTITGGGGTASRGIDATTSNLVVSGNPMIGGGTGTALASGMHLYDNGGGFIVVTDNTFDGQGGGADATTYGAYVGDGSVNMTLERNTFHGGAGGLMSTGLNLYGGAQQVLDNIMDGGAGSNAIGLALANFSTASVVNNTIVGGSSALYTYGVVVNNSDPALQGNSIHGGTAIPDGFSYGVLVASGAPTLVDNILIHGGDGGQASFGVQLYSDGTATVTGNVIQGGAARYNAYGVYSQASGTPPVVSGNTIRSGTASNAAWGAELADGAVIVLHHNTISAMEAASNQTGGINAYNASGEIYANAIWAGGGDASYGLYDFGSDLLVYNNTIHAGYGVAPRGAFLFGSASQVYNNTLYGGGRPGDAARSLWMGRGTPTVVNNIIFGHGGSNATCVEEEFSDVDGGSTNPAAFSHNDLYGCDTLYLDEGQTDLTTIAAVNSLYSTTTNVSDDPGFEDATGPDGDLAVGEDEDWHLTLASPTSVKNGGDDLSSEFTTDMDDKNRSVPWSMGAYEAPVQIWGD